MFAAITLFNLYTDSVCHGFCWSPELTEFRHSCELLPAARKVTSVTTQIDLHSRHKTLMKSHVTEAGNFSEQGRDSLPGSSRSDDALSLSWHAEAALTTSLCHELTSGPACPSRTCREPACSKSGVCECALKPAACDCGRIRKTLSRPGIQALWQSCKALTKTLPRLQRRLGGAMHHDALGDSAMAMLTPLTGRMRQKAVRRP